MNTIGNIQYSVSLLIFILYGLTGALLGHLAFSLVNVISTFKNQILIMFKKETKALSLLKSNFRMKIRGRNGQHKILSFCFYFFFTLSLSVLFYIFHSGNIRALHLLFAFVSYFVFLKIFSKLSFISDYIYKIISTVLFIALLPSKLIINKTDKAIKSYLTKIKG